MFEAQDQILNQLRSGEDGVSEFKTLRFGRHGVIDPAAESIAGELVAFANAAGGALFLGIGDDGSVEGIPKSRHEVVETWISNIAAQNCEPPIRPTIRRQALEDAAGNEQTIMLVEVPRGLYVHRTSGGRYYLRIGSSKRDLHPPELARLFQERGRDYVFDEQPAHAASVADLDRHRLEAHFGRSPTIPWLDLLRNTGVTHRDEHGEDRPTVAGLLVFGREPTRHLPSAFIEAACYSGTALTSEELVHAEQFSGPLAEQIDGAIAFVDHFMRQGGRPSERSSAALPYDIEVVDEAVVNAAAHRGLRPLRLQDSAFPIHGPPGAVQPRWLAEHHHPRGHGLSNPHPQSALGELPVPNPQQADRGCLPGVPRRGRAQDTGAQQDPFRADAQLRTVR